MLRVVSDHGVDLTQLAERHMATLADLLSTPAKSVEPTPARETVAEPSPEREAPRGAARHLQRTIRVNLEHLDGLIDLVGELLVSRRRLDRRLADFDRMAEVLRTSRDRMD